MLVRSNRSSRSAAAQATAEFRANTPCGPDTKLGFLSRRRCYELVLGGRRVSLAPNSEVEVSLSHSDYEFFNGLLTGLADTCWVEGANPRRIQIRAHSTTEIAYEVRCADPWNLPHAVYLTMGYWGKPGPGTHMINKIGGDRILGLQWGVPTWDGGVVAFSRSYCRGGPYCGTLYSDFYLANLDGTDVRILNDSVPSGGPLVWSRDGRRVFAGNLPFEVSGPIPVPLRFEPVAWWRQFWRGRIGGFSQDGRYLLYSTQNTQDCIWLWDFWDETNIPLGPGEDATLSPDSHLIAFILDGELHVMNHDGTGRRHLAGTSGHARCPVFSDSGQLLAFESVRSGVSEVRVARVDGGGDWSVTPGRTGEMCPSHPATGVRPHIAFGRSMTPPSCL